MQTITPAAAKVELKKRGHTLHSAAAIIGRSPWWISRVLNGHKASQPVLRAIFQLPQGPGRRAHATPPAAA